MKASFRSCVALALSCLGVAGVVATTTGCSGPQVVRVYRGVSESGRFISPSAYAAFLRGSEWEVRGDSAKAQLAYRQAIRFDADNVAARARLIAVYCAQRDSDAAEQRYREVLERNPEYADAHYEWARCQVQRGDQQGALSAVRRAVAASPNDERAVILLAEQLALVGKRGEAAIWLRALVRQQPGSVGAWRALQTIAEPNGAWAQHAAAAEQRVLRRNNVMPKMRSIAGAAPSGRKSTSFGRKLKAALLSGRMEKARALVRRAGKPPILLAWRALQFGDAEFALEEAQLRVAADPDDYAAKAVLALAFDAKGQPERAAELLFQAKTPEHVDSMTRRIMAELLERHVGQEGSALFVSAALLNEAVRSPIRSSTSATEQEPKP